jgi:hypothetical protein
MNKCSVGLAALPVVYLIFPISAATAQSEIPTGDVWPSREDRVYVPREALELPDTIAPGDAEIAPGRCVAISEETDPNSAGGLGAKQCR